jgi:glycosyltransferase involved in cell wall biosynthesis
MTNIHQDNIDAEEMIGFVFTNYNNSNLTIQALKSIFSSPSSYRCFVVVVDNCSHDDEVQILSEAKYIHNNIHIVENKDNVGYFCGLNVGVSYLRDRFPGLNTVVIGNNDLVFPIDFVNLLDCSKHQFSFLPVICPDIVTLDDVHQNPHVIKDISRFREIVWDVYFSNYHLAMIIQKVASLLRTMFNRKDYQSHSIPQYIYQGYGACYILTKCFFDHFESLWAPTFLMGEEFFLAKQLESRGYRMFYEPSISVRHHDHASMSKLPSKRLWHITKTYHKIYRKFISPFKVKMDSGYGYHDYLKDNKNVEN